MARTIGAFIVQVARVHFGDQCFQYDGKTWTQKPGSFRSPGFGQTGDLPAVCINWDDATAYAAWLSKKTGQPYRLLTESEWEYAARAATEATPLPRYPFGNDVTKLCDYANGADKTAAAKFNWNDANTCTDGFAYTAPVGSFKPNAFGLNDTLGNAWEWVQDCFVDTYNEPLPNDGTARKDTSTGCRRVVRGGSWGDFPRFLRAANRYGRTTGNRVIGSGFRVGRTLPGT